MKHIEFLQLELTGSCDLECVQCYAESGPLVSHGPMTAEDWIGAINQALPLGLRRVQLIGGEPTRLPGWEDVLDRAVEAGLAVSVYTNLTHIRGEWWPRLARPGVTICTSYYSDVADEHDRITTRVGSHANTRANLIEAIARGIQVKVALTPIFPGQRVAQAHAELQALGVERIEVEGVRQVGRGGYTCDVTELCGNCGRGRAAILPDGIVTPCVLGRWLKAGNIRVNTLAEILAGATWERLVGQIPRPQMPTCEADAQRMQKEKEKLHERFARI